MTKQPTISIGYVSGGSVDLAFMAGLQRFLHYDNANRKCVTSVGFRKGPFVDDNRNQLVREFLPAPDHADFFLSLDTDIDFDPEIIYPMLDDAVKNDRAIVAALHFGFDSVHNQIVPLWFMNNPNGGGIDGIGAFTTGTVIPVDAVGMGCTLIRRDVFEKIAAVPEWMEDGWAWFPRDPITIDGRALRSGEDVGFCRRAKKVGFQTWGNACVQARHWKKLALDFNLFRIWYEANQPK